MINDINRIDINYSNKQLDYECDNICLFIVGCASAFVVIAGGATTAVSVVLAGIGLPAVALAGSANPYRC